MKNVKVLDCTLRDGGRIINCAFDDQEIKDISKRLSEANIDIVEVGFIRDWKKVGYKGNSTFFTDVDQIRSFITRSRKNVMYTAFVDFGMCDIDNLKPYDGTSIDAIRFGFTKKNYDESRDEVLRWINIIKKRGYKLFIQGVNSLSYSDRELLEVVEMVNDVHPYSFGIVDTYGAMYMDDVDRLYRLIDHNLLPDICINFHSHNNYQLSFALAQEIIKLSLNGTRKIIIDGTLSGMGKVAGNLNIELLVDFLNRKLKYNYDLDVLLDTIDDYIHKYALKEQWGYSVASLMAGIYKSHPNNVIYLTEKFRLDTKDIGKLLSMIEPEKRQRYDYENIQRIYKEYNHTKIDDRKALEKLHDLLDTRNILVLVPGASIVEYSDTIKKYIVENNCFVISVNFVSNYADINNRLTFFGSSKRYKKSSERLNEKNIVVVSNVENCNVNDMVVNYESLIERETDDFDNTMIMLLNLLRRLDIKKYAVAGFDGYSKNKNNYFDDSKFEGNRFETKFATITENMRKMLESYSMSLNKKSDVNFLTPSIYADIFEE